MKKVYISGQITGLSVEKFTHNFKMAESKLNLLAGFEELKIVNPLDIVPFLNRKTWVCYMINDIKALRKCTHIAMQKNWVNSRGAVVEYFFAKFIFKQQIIWL